MYSWRFGSDGKDGKYEDVGVSYFVVAQSNGANDNGDNVNSTNVGKSVTDIGNELSH